MHEDRPSQAMRHQNEQALPQKAGSFRELHVDETARMPDQVDERLRQSERQPAEGGRQPAESGRRVTAGVRRMTDGREGGRQP